MPEQQTSAGTSGGHIIARRLARVPDQVAAEALLREIATPQIGLAPYTTDAPIALYGAGNLGRMARDFLNAVGCRFHVVIDRNAVNLRHDPEWKSTPVLHPDEVSDDIKRSHVLLVTVATAPYAPIEQGLHDAGFAHVVPFYDFAEGFRDIHPLSNGWFAPAFTPFDLRMAQRALLGFGDGISRAHHLQFLAWRRLRQEWVFEGAPVIGDDRFFVPEILGALAEDEVFVDGGAHQGSCIEYFIARMNGCFAQIIAVEPDATNRAGLTARVSRLLPGDPRVSVIGVALGSAAGEAQFHAGLGYASQLSPTGKHRVHVMKLDDLERASFVKLHLEGAELEALKGGRELFLRERPIIVATVYHNDDGIWRTPLWLMDSLPNYRFLFRLHSWCGTGAVVYAIPEERWYR